MLKLFRKEVLLWDTIIKTFFNVCDTKIDFPNIKIHDKEYCEIYIKGFFDKINFLKIDEIIRKDYLINKNVDPTTIGEGILFNFKKNSINFITFNKDKTIEFSIISNFKDEQYITKWDLSSNLEARFIGFIKEKNRSIFLKNKVLKINVDKQNKHILQTKEFKNGRSIISLSIDECNNVIEQFAGTGTFINENHEIINCGYIIGYWRDISTGYLYPTTEAKIHYSNTGTHLVPLKPKF